MNTIALRTTRSTSTDVAMQALYAVAARLSATRSARGALPEVLAILVECLELSDAAIAIARAGQAPELIGAGGVEAMGLKLRAHSGAAFARVGATQIPWIVESEWAEDALDATYAPRRDTYLDLSFVSVPIKGGGQLTGVLSIERVHSPGDQAAFCFDDDVRLLSVVTNMIALRARLEPPQPRQPRQPQVSAVRVEIQRQTATEGPAESNAVTGDSPAWRSVRDRASTVAKSSATVMLRGESGTGKEVLARFIHEASARRAKPFIRVNCAALSESVLESELFGHERGAFTGASAQRKGRFELADGGTLFLDEIGEISTAFQARLLRVLQLGEFERVGGTSTLAVDVRLIAATNRNLEEDVRSGRFRSDLYYRISVVPLFLPALRERPTDIVPLAREFLRRFNASNGTELRLDVSAYDALLAYPFPGNVRELENTVHRAASLARGPVLEAADFEWLNVGSPLTAALAERFPEAGTPTPSRELPPAPPSARSELGARLADDPARARLIDALERTGWVQAKAARLLGLTPRQIAYALHKYQIQVRKF